MSNYTLFNNPECIETARDIRVDEIEVLYWKLEDLIYDQKTDEAKNLLDLFLYIGKFNSSVLRALKSDYRTRLKHIVFELHGETVPAQKTAIRMLDEREPKEILFVNEAELRDFLASNPELLHVIDPSLRYLGKEIKTDFEFRCDLIADTSSLFFPIELKVVQAKHDVVSQIDKYCYFFYRRLRYNHFKHIQGIVIANGFCGWTINQLRRSGHWIFDLQPDSNQRVRLERIF